MSTVPRTCIRVGAAPRVGKPACHGARENERAQGGQSQSWRCRRKSSGITLIPNASPPRRQKRTHTHTSAASSPSHTPTHHALHCQPALSTQSRTHLRQGSDDTSAYTHVCRRSAVAYRSEVVVTGTTTQKPAFHGKIATNTWERVHDHTRTQPQQRLLPTAGVGVSSPTPELESTQRPSSQPGLALWVRGPWCSLPPRKCLPDWPQCGSRWPCVALAAGLGPGIGIRSSACALAPCPATPGRCAPVPPAYQGLALSSFQK